MEEALTETAINGSKRALIVTDKGIVRSGILQRVITCLREKGLDVEVFSDVYPDPNMECIRNGVDVCKGFQPDTMICLGGGSPIDAGKFIRVQYEHPELTLEDASARFIEIRKRYDPSHAICYKPWTKHLYQTPCLHLNCLSNIQGLLLSPRPGR